MDSAAGPPAGRTASPDGPGTLALFFVLAYALMWACFIPVAVAIPAGSPLGGALLLLGRSRRRSRRSC